MTMMTNNNPEKSSSRSSFGIIGAEFYFPKNFVDQTELEKFYGEGSGKYTKGFGQLEMSFCYPIEDVCSMALTVTSELLKNYKVDKRKVGFLAVGTETLLDGSKSVKTILMDLFKTPASPIGNGDDPKVNGHCSDDEADDSLDIEGADVKNACFGGTQALFHAVDWLHSNWETESKLAIVVCADVAVYQKGPARPTGGAGAIAFLLGPNAPLVFEPGLRAFSNSNVYDFYKPLNRTCTEYPKVFGGTSIDAYMTSASKCYLLYQKKYKRKFGQKPSLDDFYAVLFHSPYTRLAQKTFCSMAFEDFKRGALLKNAEKLKKYNGIPGSDAPKEKVKAFWDELMSASNELLAQKLDPHLEFNRRLGNMYTPSLWAQFLNLIKNSSSSPEELDKKRLLMYSYGSGSIAATFSLRFNFPPVNCSKQSPGELTRSAFTAMQRSVNASFQRLENRTKLTPEDFDSVLEKRAKFVGDSEGLTEEQSKTMVPTLFPGSYYLCRIDSDQRRFYSKN